MRKYLFAVLLLATTAFANETSYRMLQSGSPTGATPLFDRGIHGEGQIIAVLDTGVDVTSCYFAEPDASLPPMNTGTPNGGLDWENVDLTRRKVIAYDYLYSCDQYPGRIGCEEPGPNTLDSYPGHGTHAAGTALGDKGAPIAHDYADAIAPGAKLVVQDGGLLGDSCTQRPGIGCPVQLLPILEQAYKQGARIHSNSWGDRQGAGPYSMPPTGNYPQAARDVDAFVWAHQDMLVVFNTGNWGIEGVEPGKSSLSAPGSAKNTLQIGGTRNNGRDDDTLYEFTLYGPARDGRIKPDLVGPASVIAGDIDFDQNPDTCDATRQPGTSWASPTIAGAAALVRQYYTDGFYEGHPFTPSAALLKATLIAAAHRVPWRRLGRKTYATLPVPSYEQGWGFPVLDDALYFQGDTRDLQVRDVPLSQGLAEGETRTVRVNVKAGTPLKAVLVWIDPPGTVRPLSDTTPQLVNDLDLRITKAGTTYLGNGGNPDRLNNVEVVSIDDPAAGTYDISIEAHHLGFGARQSYALVITGDLATASRTRSVRH